MRTGLRGWLAALYLGACILLGGASGTGAGAAGNAMLQIGAVAIILVLLWSRRATLPPAGRAPALIIGLFALIGLLSLIPLPPSLWQSLPYRDEIASSLGLIGVNGVSLPLSLAPQSTIASLLWLLPPLAMFLLVLTLPPDQRRKLCTTILIMAAASIVLGAFQLLSGTQSPLRFYAITNADSAVGFFANRNHQATLVLCAIPCAALLAARFASKRNRSKRSGGLAIIVSAAILLLTGIGITGSTAGFGLAIPAVFAAVLIYRRSLYGPVGRRWLAGLATILVLFLVLALAGPVNQEKLSEDLSDQPLSRATFALTTIQATAETFPVGTGLGTFAEVYRRFQDPNLASREYANHAHNDYLEVALELGLPGILLVLAGIFWWLKRSVHSWRSEAAGASLGRTGSVIIGVVLLHSLVDYPLRTSAIAAVFAVACALMVPFLARRTEEGDSAQAGSRRSARHLEAD